MEEFAEEVLYCLCRTGIGKKIVRYTRMSGDLRLFAGREWLPIVDSFNCLWRQSYAA